MKRATLLFILLSMLTITSCKTTKEFVKSQDEIELDEIAQRNTELFLKAGMQEDPANNLADELKVLDRSLKGFSGAAPTGQERTVYMKEHASKRDQKIRSAMTSAQYEKYLELLRSNRKRVDVTPNPQRVKIQSKKDSQ